MSRTKSSGGSDKVRVTVSGVRPLLMHNVRLASPLDPFAKALKAITSKRKKTDEDYYAMARIEFEGSLYFDEEAGPFMPHASILKSLMQGGVLTKSGTKIERGVTLLGGHDLGVTGDPGVPLLYSGPRDVEGLWGEGESPFIDQRLVKVGQNRVLRTRPIFRNWGFEFEAHIDPTVLNMDEFVSVAQDAGRVAHIGDYRRFFGDYEVSVAVL